MNSQKKRRLQLLKQIVNLRTLDAVAILMVLGIVLILAVIYLGWFKNHPIISSLGTQFGGLLIVSASITIVWELVGKRAFAEEVLDPKQASSLRLPRSGADDFTGT